MNVKEYNLEPNPREIIVNAHNDIFLSVEIGNGQIGGNKVTFSGTLLAKGNLSKQTFIGRSDDLHNKEIEIETNVLDVNSFTNVCVITTTFTNQQNNTLFSIIDKGNAPENGVASFKGNYLFRVLTIMVLVLGFSFMEMMSQNNNFTFTDLETPSSPGLILLDQAPASIEKPTTPQGVGLSLLGVQKDGGALEFAPFWLTTHPKLTADKMYKNKFPILYNFALSFSSLKSDSFNYYGGGIRTRLIQLYSNKFIQRLDSLKSQLELALSDMNVERITELQRKYMEIIEKPVFMVDFAAALAEGSLTNSFKDLELSRWAVWLSVNWRPGGDDFYMTILTRYMYNNNYENYANTTYMTDVGLRLNYDISKFCLSLEILQRMAQENNDHRIAFIGSYKLSENLFITSTLGKNFNSVNNIIALVGINFGYSRNKIKAF